MGTDEIILNLPPLRQKLTVLVLGIIAILWMVRMLRRHRLREEHALLWFLGILGGLAATWSDHLLVGITRALGVDVPASALILLAVFFLLLITVWLTTVVSRQKQQIAKLIVTVSILKARMQEQAGGETTSPAVHSSTSGRS